MKNSEMIPFGYIVPKTMVPKMNQYSCLKKSLKSAKVTGNIVISINIGQE